MIQCMHANVSPAKELALWLLSSGPFKHTYKSLITLSLQHNEVDNVPDDGSQGGCTEKLPLWHEQTVDGGC